ncbi:MAG TPA: PqqD family peptide modification chaperone [Solirubrobacteraceae bacterium]|nr:PqqD family peptide modification chaperone [Solirubrobacteraceae bacterium]
MSAITASSVVARSEDAIAAPLGEELAMMDVEAGKYYMLDDIGSRIWSSLDAPRRVSDLVEDLERRYEVTRERCETDVIALLARMHEKGLVRIGG